MCGVVLDTLCFQDVNKPNVFLFLLFFYDGCLVEGVLVLHGAGPAGPVGVVVILGRSARTLQQALGAVATALQAAAAQPRTGVAPGEGRHGSGRGRGAGGQGPVGRRSRSGRVKGRLDGIRPAGRIPRRSENRRHGRICGRTKKVFLKSGHVCRNETTLVAGRPGESGVKSSFMNQYVNTGSVCLLYYPFS